jgi:hypothetical protein
VERVEKDGSWEGIVGRPEVAERASGLHFRHESLHLGELAGDRILDVRPVQAVDQNLWVAVTGAGQLLRLDLDDRSAAAIRPLTGSNLNFADPVTLHLSGDGRMAAVVNTHGQSGVVVDLGSGKATMPLQRDDYHNEHCTFPAAFCEVDGRLLLIHATAWNRLDVSDPASGELLTDRPPPVYRQGEDRPAHYLDYFHCGLSVSPGQEYVVDNGWVWAPVGVLTSWSVRRWLRENVWESEDGPSKQTLCWRNYHWDAPLCWVGDVRLAVWGYGEDDEWLLPAVRIFDVATGREERWFPGPRGSLAFDGYLFSFDGADGTSVWDADTGERLVRESSFCPLRYHPGAKTFLTVMPDGLLRVSKLCGRPVDPGWLAWGSGAVVRLARAIRAGRAFDRLPILADALQEAGCQDAALLSHCRRPGPHGKDCWVVDRILDR